MMGQRRRSKMSGVDKNNSETQPVGNHTNARRIGGDWVRTSTGDGETYYANLVTRETSWSFPVDLR
jgi:hypothetical protein